MRNILLITLIILSCNVHADKFEKFLVQDLKDIQEVARQCQENVESDLDMIQLYYIMGQEKQTERILLKYEVLKRKKD